MDVKIIETATGRQVPAEIRPARSQDVVLWLDWHGQMPADAENGHWRWDQYILLAEMFPQELACFVLVAEEALQGITLIEQEHENDLGGEGCPWPADFDSSVESASQETIQVCRLSARGTGRPGELGKGIRRTDVAGVTTQGRRVLSGLGNDKDSRA